MEELVDNPNLLSRWGTVRYAFTFVERDADRASMLEDVLRELERDRRASGAWTQRISWAVIAGRYEEHVPQPVAERNSALFLFLDPFGYSDAPMTLATRLVQQPKSDTLIFLPLSYVHRFADREGQDQALDRFFGTPAWRDVHDGRGRPKALLDLFQAQLRSAGLTYTLPFRLKPPDRRNAYWIVGASSHLRGFASIKEGYWAVDPVDGSGFAAPKPVGARSSGNSRLPAPIQHLCSPSSGHSSVVPGSRSRTRWRRPRARASSTGISRSGHLSPRRKTARSKWTGPVAAGGSKPAWRPGCAFADPSDRRTNICSYQGRSRPPGGE
jgi:three-Cys-motif partner protein